jgi:hypothetical protein
MCGSKWIGEGKEREKTLFLHDKEAMVENNCS